MPKKQNSAAPAPGENKLAMKAKQRQKTRIVPSRKKTKRAATKPQAAPNKTTSQPAQSADAKPVLRPRVRIGDAMRTTGLDEFKVAATFADVVDKLSGKPRGDGGVQKLLVDVLKECSRHLDAQHSDRDSRDSNGPITLIHCVPRPDRSPSARPQLEAEPAGTVLDVKPLLKEAP